MQLTSTSAHDDPDVVRSSTVSSATPATRGDNAEKAPPKKKQKKRGRKKRKTRKSDNETDSTVDTDSDSDVTQNALRPMKDNAKLQARNEARKAQHKEEALKLAQRKDAREEVEAKAQSAREERALKVDEWQMEDAKWKEYDRLKMLTDDISKKRAACLLESLLPPEV
jgi:hypothetical protein